MHADDGIVLRLPDTELLDDGDGAPAPAPSRPCSTPDEVEALVTAEVGGSALFAVPVPRVRRPRAAAAPARPAAGARPLWQQRQRSAQLLSVASEYGSFPIVLETMRECLQDVFDVPGLVALMRDVAAREVRVVEVETPQPSPFARSLLFGYVAQFLYEGDSPLAERRAAALALDSDAARRAARPGRAARAARPRRRRASSSASCSGSPPDAARARRRGRRRPAAAARAAHHRRGRCARGADARTGSPSWSSARRAIRGARRRRGALGRRRGRRRGCATRSASPLPVGVPEAFLEPVADPLGDLVAPLRPHPRPVHRRRRRGPVRARRRRRRRTRSPAGRRRPGRRRRVPPRRQPAPSGATPRCCARCAAARSPRCARRSSRSPPRALGRVPARLAAASAAALRGVDGRAARGRAAAGRAVPASALESLVLPPGSPTTRPRCSTS